MVLARRLVDDADDTQGVIARVELAAEDVDRLDAVGEPVFAGLPEIDFDDVTLGRSDGDALHHLLALEAPDVSAYQLHRRATEGEVEGARVRHVGQKEAYDFAPRHSQPVLRLAVHEQQVAEAAQQRLRRPLLAVGEDAPLVQQQVVQDQHLLAVHRVEVVGRWVPHHDVAVKTQILLDLAAHVRVVPVDARIRKVHFVQKAFPRFHRFLRDGGHAIEAVVHTHAVPVDRAG